MRAADDFVAIRARMEQLQRERQTGRESEQGPARTDAHIIGASDPKAIEEMKVRIRDRNRLWMAEHR